MKIYEQLNNNDCGISVTQSLINHFYSIDIDKEELYENSNISEEGMSLLDLENLNRKYGIILESYEVEYEELKNYPDNNYFILLLKIGDLLHYVIAKKKKNYITIFDSMRGKIKTTLQELRENFTNILISINFSRKIDLIYNKIKRNDPLINLKKTIRHLLINISVLSLSLISAYFTKWILENLFSIQDMYEWGPIIFVAGISYFLISTGEYINSCLSLKDKNYYQKSLFHLFLSSLENKKNSFFSKIGKNQFLLLKDHIDNISSYYSEYLHQWIISAITIFISINCLMYINIYFLPIIFISMGFQVFYSYMSKKNHKKYFPKILHLQGIERKFNFELEKFISEEENIEKLLSINTKIKNNFSQHICTYRKLFLKNLFFEKNNLFFENLIFFALCICGAIFYLKNSLSIGNLIISSSFYGYLNKSCQKLINFYCFKNHFIYSNKIYQQLINIDNIQDNANENWDIPRIISIKNLSFYSANKKIFKNFNLTIKNGTFIYGKSGSGKTTLYRLISQKISPSSGEILFNKHNIKTINQKNFKKNLIYQISDSLIQEFYWEKTLKNFNDKQIIWVKTIIENLGMKISEKPDISKLSKGQKQFLNFLNLFNYSEKILLLDEVLSHINSENKLIIVEYLMPILIKKNFVVLCEHDLKLKKFFKYSKNIENND